MLSFSALQPTAISRGGGTAWRPVTWRPRLLTGAPASWCLKGRRAWAARRALCFLLSLHLDLLLAWRTAPRSDGVPAAPRHLQPPRPAPAPAPALPPQEHFYLEPNAAIVVPGENDEYLAYSSTQVGCIAFFYLRQACRRTCGRRHHGSRQRGAACSARPGQPPKGACSHAVAPTCPAPPCHPSPCSAPTSTSATWHMCWGCPCTRWWCVPSAWVSLPLIALSCCFSAAAHQGAACVARPCTRSTPAPNGASLSAL